MKYRNLNRYHWSTASLHQQLPETLRDVDPFGGNCQRKKKPITSPAVALELEQQPLVISSSTSAIKEEEPSSDMPHVEVCLYVGEKSKPC